MSDQSLREALEELHFLYDNVPGYPVCDHDEQTWPCDRRLRQARAVLALLDGLTYRRRTGHG